MALRRKPPPGPGRQGVGFGCGRERATAHSFRPRREGLLQQIETIHIGAHELGALPLCQPEPSAEEVG